MRLFKILTPDEAALAPLHPDDVLLWDDEQGRGVCDEVSVTNLRDPAVVGPGDVVRLREGSSLVSVLYRRGSAANVLFITEQCNSRCLMCSQPPRDEDDRWRTNELLDLIPLIDGNEVQLGVTGGEPTLHPEGLLGVLEQCELYLPDAHLHVLTNGRQFRDRDLAERLVDAAGDRATWAVPLYADNPWRHDEIVDAEGAFEETLQGLAELARLGARVEIRVVLHALSIPRLVPLSDLIWRRLPFVEHVALMGLEPMGLAKSNRERLWVDPADYAEPLEIATRRLADRGMKVSIYNLPLCVLPQSVWPYARQSISDWKNKLLPCCEPCLVKDKCAGFFESAGEAWRSRDISPILVQEFADELA